MDLHEDETKVNRCKLGYEASSGVRRYHNLTILSLNIHILGMYMSIIVEDMAFEQMLHYEL